MYGPDGKPINPQQLMGGQLLGQPKTLNDIEVYDEKTIDAFADGAEQMLSQGLPVEVPAAMPMGQIAQCAKTMKAQHERIKELEAKLASLKAGAGEEGGEQVVPRLDLSSLGRGGTLNLGDLTGDTAE